MKGRRVVGGMCGALAAVLVGVSTALNSPSDEKVDYEAVAQKLVNESAGIKEGEIVLVSGGIRDFELLENIAVHVRRAGAFPLLTVDSDRMTQRMMDDVPAKYDSQRPELALKLTEMISAFISVDSNEDPKLMADVPPERLAAQAEAFAPVIELSRERNVRNVNLGNGLYPSAATAELFGVPREELAKIFWGGVDADYAQLQATGEALKKALAGGKEVRITNPNGTDLKVKIAGRQVFVSDGVISAEDVKEGRAATQVWLPAGEVYLAPEPGTAEGRLVVDRDFFQGKEIRRLDFTFKGGKVTSMSAESGMEAFQALYDATGTGKEQFAYVDIGINPNVRLVPGSRMTAFMPAGMVTVGIGGNTWAGGENTVLFGTSYFLPGSTLKVDGKTIVEAGKLKA